MDTKTKVQVNLFYENISPIKNGTVTVNDENKMDFIIYDGKLILSDENASDVTKNSVWEELKKLGFNVFKLERV